MDLSEIQLGPLAAWVAALLTVGTLFMSLRLYRREQESRRRAQARKINAWPEDVDVSKKTISARLRNSSDEPVYNVHVMAYLLESIHPFFYDWYASWHEYALSPLNDTVELKSTQIVPLPDESRNPPLTIPKMAITVSFVDASGLGWTRDPRGRLTEQNTSRGRLTSWFIMWHQENGGRRRAAYTKWLYDYVNVPRVWRYDPDRVRWAYIKHPRGYEYETERSERLFGAKPNPEQENKS
jgi:YD repeat-containing protein